MKYFYFVIFGCLISFLYSCKKYMPPDLSNNCDEILQVRIVAEKTSYEVGEEIYFTVNELPTISLFNWRHSKAVNVISQYAYIHYPKAEKNHEGWYYLSVGYPDCPSVLYDSVYITVKNKPSNAPCTPANNTVTFSSIPDLSPATVSWKYDNSWNRKVLEARGGYGYPEFNIYFNTYWDTEEPEDGEYSITDMPSTGSYPPYTVNISALYGGIFFQTAAGSGKVYVTHVNGKLQATFCEVELSGSNGGPTYKVKASGKLTAP